MSRERKPRLDALAVGLLVACCLFWGYQQALVKHTIAEVPPLWQASIRFVGATVLLLLWCRVRGIPLFARDGTGLSGLLAGGLFAAEFCGIYLGLQNTSASRLTVLLYTAPFFLALLLPRFVPAERLRAIQWLGLGVAFAAVAYAMAGGMVHGGVQQLQGDALALAAGVLWAATTLTIRCTSLALSTPEKTLFYQVAVTSLVAPLLSLWLGEPWSLHYSGDAWWSLAQQTLVGAFASYLAWMWLLRHYPATRLASLTFLTPVFALLCGVWMLGEPLTLGVVAGLVGVGLGIVLVNRPAPARAP